jgi:hypothetical protein
MSEYFANQPSIVAFSGVELTSAYTGNRFEFATGGFTKLTLDLSYAQGAAETGNTMQFQLEHSPDDGVNWYSLVIDATDTVSTITAREWTMAPAKLNVIIDIAYKKMRLSLKETGVDANEGTASVSLTLSGL